MTPTAPLDVLRCWSMTASDPHILDTARGFSGAAMLRVETRIGAYGLRCWPTGAAGLPEARIRELHRWVASLADGGITTVAVPLRATDGATLVHRHERLWQLEPWLRGAADFHSTPNDDRLRSAFGALARLHLTAERYVPTSPGIQWFYSGHGVPPAVIERFVKLRGLGAQLRAEPLVREDANGVPARREPRPPDVHDQTALANRLTAMVADVAPRIAAELEDCADIRVPLHPCLRDVWHDHVLFTGDEVTGIIDASAARTENVASDLSRLLGSFLGDAFNRWETALEAYAAIRPLSADERRLIPVLDRSGVVLSAAHWLARMRRTSLADREWRRVKAIAQRVTVLAGVVRASG